MEDQIIGDLKQDEIGEVYIYAGKAGWRRVVEPEKQWNYLTEDEIIDELNKRKFDWVAVRSTTYIIDSPEIKQFARDVITAFKEKNK